MTIAPTDMLQPGRPITGMSAILLPHTHAGDVDWPGFEHHVERTVDAGLVPAVNMDTGFVQLLDDRIKTDVLDRTAAIVADSGLGFVAGAFVADQPGDPFDLEAMSRAAAHISNCGGTPIVFPSHGLNGAGDAAWLDSLGAFAAEVDRFIGFELGTMFVPYGRVVSLETYRGLLSIPQCIGAKHSSLQRQLEWQRLALRDEVRPDFLVLTGNDLAIDMVMYGSDYLLGLSTFAPHAFARRDRMWADGDPRFYELNDLLQYLGEFAFRSPVPGYRHNAAMFLRLRGSIDSDAIPSQAPRRPSADREVLRDISERLAAWEQPDV